MNKKGQAAMEFLMTYGWAIIIVLAAIGALAYFGVLSPQKLLPERTTFPAPLANIDNAVIDHTDGNVSIAFKNNKGVAIRFDSLSAVSGTEDCAAPSGFTLADDAGATIAAAAPIENGDGFVMTVNGCDTGTVGARFKTDISFSYQNDETGQTLKQTGSVQGKYS
jgi:hypothetical protein